MKRGKHVLQLVQPESPWVFDKNWIKLPRIALDLTCDPASLVVYVALLSRVAWSPQIAMLRKGPAKLKIGETVFGREELSRKTGLSPRVVRRALAVLKGVGAIEIVSADRRGSLVSIVGYAKTYRPSDEQRLQYAESAVRRVRLRRGPV